MMFITLTLLWIAYILLHSWLAGTQAKQLARQRWPQWFPYYRLLFNGFAVISIIPILAIVLLSPGELWWQWQGVGQWLMNTLALAALGGIFYSMQYYDGGAFLGLKPNLENRIGSADEPFTLSPLHRFVRHPWYTFSLVLIWTRDMNTAWLISCLAITAYFFIGSRLEDKKLIQEYGEPYKRYAEKVSGIIPLPGKILTAEEAATLTNNH